MTSSHILVTSSHRLVPSRYDGLTIHHELIARGWTGFKNSWADPERGTGGPDPSLKNHKNIRCNSNIGPDPLKIHKASKLAFNVWQSSHTSNADDGLFIVVFGSSLPS